MRIACALIALWLASCDQCQDGESRCFHDGLATCEYGQWAIGFCCAQDGCREVDGPDGESFATCTPSDAPDPRCDDADSFDEICVGNTRLSCTLGYGSAERACDGVCVRPTPGVAFCALADQLDARCSDRKIRQHCDGSGILTCANGYAVDETPCEAPFVECTSVPDNLGGTHPRCATPINPIGDCAGDSPGRCDGNDIFSCTGGRKTFEHCELSCYENPIDSMFPEAFCEGPPCDDGV